MRRDLLQKILFKRGPSNVSFSLGSGLARVSQTVLHGWAGTVDVRHDP